MFTNKLENAINSYSEIIIYGTGFIGRRFLWWTEENNMLHKIKYFADVSSNRTLNNIHEIPVTDIVDLCGRADKALIVLAIDEKEHKEGIDRLKKLGFKNILPINHRLNNFLKKEEEKRTASEKQRKVLYICATYYHVLISVSKIMLTKQRADIMLTNESSKNYRLGCRLLQSGCVENVIYNEYNRIIEFNTNNKILDRLVYRRHNRKNVEKEVPINFKRYKDVYMYYDHNVIGRYLQAIKCDYHYIEDGRDFFKSICPHSSPEMVAYWSSKQYRVDTLFDLGYQKFGQSKHCKSIEVNDKEGICIPESNLHKVREYPRDKLFAELTRENKQVIYDIFIGTGSFNFTEGEKTILILTQPLNEKWAEPFKSEVITHEDVYQKIIDDVKTLYDRIYIKAHPRDDYDYNLIEGIEVINKEFPVEIFNFSGRILFDKALTIFSTSIYGIDFVKEKEVLGLEYLKNFRK